MPRRWLAASATMGILLLAAGPAAAAPPYQGFGAAATGGAGYPEVAVTTLADSGDGSLRAALEGGGDRTIVFTGLSGTIALSSFIKVTGANVTIDGATAAPPGITVSGQPLHIDGNRGAHNVIVRGLRFRDSAYDGITIWNGASRVVIDQVSVARAADGNIDITEGSHDITVSWSILAEPASGKMMLIKLNNPHRISLHHNLFIKGVERNPNIAVDNGAPLTTDVTVDMRNNVIYDWGAGYGTKIHNGARANVVGNFYASPLSPDFDQAQALLVCPGNCDEPGSVVAVHAEGNVSADMPGVDINAVSNEPLPFPAPAVPTEDACLNAPVVVAQAGARPLDTRDQQYVAAVQLPACVSDVALDTLTAPAAASAGQTIAVSDRTANYGNRTAEDFTVGFYLSRDRTLGAGDAALGARLVPVVYATRASSGTTLVTIPTGTAPGSYSLLATADAGNTIPELTERNNMKYRTLKIVAPDLTVSALGAPASASGGATVILSDTTENRGDGRAAASTTGYYLKDRYGVERFLGSREVPELASGVKHAGSKSLPLPFPLPAGSYSIVGKADTGAKVKETSETNNTRTRSITIK